MKSKKIHPDAFVQMVLQLAYYNLHEEFVPTYETATMRAYYNGRTETVRSCSSDAVKFVLAMNNPNETVCVAIYILVKLLINENCFRM